MTSRSSKSNGNPTSSIQGRHLLSTSLIGDFKIGAKLGQGTFSKVCQGIHLPTGEKVAIKIMSKDQIKEKSDKIRIEKEINIQKKLHHQNIVQQYAIIETDSTIYIISEYCSGGELFDYIVSKRKLYEVEACRIYQQLISGLEYLHKQRICHRDLKPENLLFDSKHNLKIADFGLSNDYHKGKLSTPCGSPCYAAPEMVTGRKYGGTSVDIWSSGIVLYTMVCGFLPFEDDNQNILFGKIAKGLFSLPSFLSQSCKDLLKKILITDPKKRYGFEEIKHHPWFLSVNNVMGRNIFFNSPGVFVEEDVLPVDVEIIAEIHNDFHMDIAKIINDVIKNRHNKITTAYYLILRRKIRNGEISVADISSNSTSFIKYIKSSISKMAYWNNDYDKIIEYYVKAVRKYLNSISEENTISNDSKRKSNNNINNNINGNTQNENKENHDSNNLKSLETNTEKIKLNLDNMSSNVEPIDKNDNKCFTEINNNNNKNTKKNINQNEENQTLQNGGTIVATIYDENPTLVPIKSYKDKIGVRHNYSMDFEESEEPNQQKINESYKPKVTIQGFLQTDVNNIKMNARLIKEKKNLNEIKNKFNDKSKILKSEESTNMGDINNTLTNNNNNNKNYGETKETENNNTHVNRILLTEMDNVGVKNIQNSLLNKNNNNINGPNVSNNNIKNKVNNNSVETYSKKMVNNKPKNIIINLNLNKLSNMDDFIRMNTLYNKDDSDDLSSLRRDINNDTINNKILTTENNEINYVNNKTDLSNKNINKIINGLNDNNNNNDNINNNNIIYNKTKSVEKDFITNNSEINKDKEKESEKNKFYVTLPFSNQIYKQEKILKFINQKTPSMPKSKEDSKKDIPQLENGKLLLNNNNHNNINKNKYKFKNRFSQESVNSQYKNIYGINNNGLAIAKPNGSIDNNTINKNIGVYTHLNNLNIGNLNNIGNIGNILYVKKKRKPKSIDDTINRKNYLISKKESKNNITNENKNSVNNTSMNNNKEIYSKVNNIKNNKKQFYREKVYDQKLLEEPYAESFRYKKLNSNINKLNKKLESEFTNITNFTHRLNSNLNNNYLNLNNNNNNNYILEKNKNKENNKTIFNKEITNYTNLNMNKNHKLHEHNSFEGPKHTKNKIKQNYINNSVEKQHKYIINNNQIISKYPYNNNNYYKLNKKIKQYYRNIGNTKQNQPVTQYYGINNYNKIINNYNIDNIDRITNDKILAKNKRLNNQLPAKIKANSLDLQDTKNKSSINKNNSKHNNKIKNMKKTYLNTSVIKDKTPKNFISGFYKEKNKLNNFHRNNYYLNTIENNNLVNNTNKNIEENRYMTFRDKENMGLNSTRRAHVQKYLFPVHKRYNFSQEPEKKRKENDPLDIYSIYSKGNSFIFNNMNKNNLALKKEKKKINNKEQNNNNKEINNNINFNINRNIYSKASIEKIKDTVEKIVGNKIDIKKYKNFVIIDCKYKEASNSIYFGLTISTNHKEFVTISPKLVKGSQNIFKYIIEKIKNKLM